MFHSDESFPNWLEKRADLTPDRIAILTEDGKEVTFLDLHKKATKMARKFSGIGIKKGDHVALLINNSIDSVITIQALEALGAVMVLLNTRLTAHELNWQIKDAEAKILVYNEKFKSIVETIGNNILIHTYSFSDVQQLEESGVLTRLEFNHNDLHTIMYTSGTTGNPKGVMITYGNHWWSAVGSSLNLGLHEDDRWLCCLPIFHVGGLSILKRGIFYGTTTVLCDGFDPYKINEVINRQRVTIISVVSAMLSRMIDQLDASKRYPSFLRCVLLGGGPASKALLESCKKNNIPVFQTYGMTETASQIVTLTPEYMLSKLGSAGKPLFPAQLRIENNGGEAKNGEIGEIVVKGPSVTAGYFKREVETNKSIQEGWLYTGDLGYLDEDGFLYVVDRRSDLIISGGENIYPAEIESILASHASISEAGVTGIQDEKWGQVPIAFIVLKSGVILKKEEIIQYCKDKLASYKVPTKIFFVEDLPRNASNKLVRRKLLTLIKEV